jgi:hypothetical protein
VERVLEHPDEPEMAMAAHCSILMSPDTSLSLASQLLQRPASYRIKKWAPNLIGVPIFYSAPALRGKSGRIMD